MLNLCRPLALLKKPEFATRAQEGVKQLGGGPLQVYLDVEAKLKTDPTANMTLLSPRLFAAVAQRDYVKALNSHHALPLVLRQICLARSDGDPVDPTTVKPGQPYTTIGEEIPAMEIETVDLCFPLVVQKEHDTIYFSLLPKWKRPPAEVASADSGMEQA